MRDFAAMPAFQAMVEEELRPGGGALSDDAMWQFIAENAWTVFHPCGTCRMGTDPGVSVVNERLEVHGLGRLRVADASIFPSIPTGNTNGPVIATAEKAADIILTDSKA